MLGRAKDIIFAESCSRYNVLLKQQSYLSAVYQRVGSLLNDRGGGCLQTVSASRSYSQTCGIEAILQPIDSEFAREKVRTGDSVPYGNTFLMLRCCRSSQAAQTHLRSTTLQRRQSHPGHRTRMHRVRRLNCVRWNKPLHRPCSASLSPCQRDGHNYVFTHAIAADSEAVWISIEATPPCHWRGREGVQAEGSYRGANMKYMVSQGRWHPVCVGGPHIETSRIENNRCRWPTRTQSSPLSSSIWASTLSPDSSNRCTSDSAMA